MNGREDDRLVEKDGTSLIVEGGWRCAITLPDERASVATTLPRGVNGLDS